MNNLLTRKNIEILKLLKKEDSYLRDIADKLKISPGKVHSAIKLFKKHDLIKEKREKNKIIISIHRENPLLQNLINIIEERKEGMKIRLKKRQKESHKGQNGIVLIIAGSIDYVGAPALVAMAALKTGCDLAIVACPEKTALVVNSYTPDIITKKLDGNYFKLEHYEEIKELIDKADVIAIGPGLGKRKETLEFVKKILKINKNKVIDADAIQVIDLKEVNNSVITPHSHEFKVLLKNNNLKKINQKELRNNIILLKGPTDKIISKNKIKLNKTGNEGMTKGGTGDVLTGIIASLISQGNDLFDSAYYAAYINGLAADKLKEKIGYGYLASDLTNTIPLIMREM